MIQSIIHSLKYTIKVKNIILQKYDTITCVRSGLISIWSKANRWLSETLFLQGSGRVDTAIWMHYLDANKTAREEARLQLHKNVANKS